MVLPSMSSCVIEWIILPLRLVKKASSSVQWSAVQCSLDAYKCRLVQICAVHCNAEQCNKVYWNVVHRNVVHWNWVQGWGVLNLTHALYNAGPNRERQTRVSCSGLACEQVGKVHCTFFLCCERPQWVRVVYVEVMQSSIGVSSGRQHISILNWEIWRFSHPCKLNTENCVLHTWI